MLRSVPEGPYRYHQFLPLYLLIVSGKGAIIFTRLEARFSRILEFTLCGLRLVLTPYSRVGYNSSEGPKVNRLDEIWSNLSALSGAGPGRF